MENEIFSFTFGFAVSYAFGVMRIRLLKSRIKLYERYVHQRLDETVDRLRNGLISH